MNRGSILYSLLGLISLTGGIVALGDKSGGLSVMEGCVCQERCSRGLASGGVGRSLELDLWFVRQGKFVEESGGLFSLTAESFPSVGEVLQRYSNLGRGVYHLLSDFIIDYMDQIYHSGKSTFTSLCYRELLIATWGNRLLTKGVLLWNRLIAIFVVLLAFPWSILNQFTYVFVALEQMNPLRVLIFLPFSLQWSAWFCSHLLDTSFRQCIQICNMYLWKRAFFLFGYYSLLTGGFTYLGELLTCLFCWLMVSAFFSYLNFEDFYCYENRFLSGEESLEARVRSAVMHGNLHLLDGYLPYSMSYSYRGGYVEYLFKSLWRGKDKLTKSVTFRIPYQEDFSLSCNHSTDDSNSESSVAEDSRPMKKKKRSGGMSKSAIIAASMHRITMNNEKELRNFARTWSYCCFIKAHAQAKCDPVPRQFYVGQSVYNAFMDQRGEHVDYFEDVATLMASLVFAAQHTDTLAKSSSVTLAINNFRKSKLGTRISNGLAQTQLDLSEMLESSEIGEQINDFVEHISNITSNAKRTLKKFGATGFESSIEVGRLGLKMASMLMANESTSVFRQKVERREETKRFQERMAASAAKTKVQNAIAEESDKRKLMAELAAAPEEFGGTWAQLPMNNDIATAQAGFIDSIEALRNVMSMGRESMQTITSGKVVKLIASLLALGTIIRTGSFYLANYEEMVSHIRAHPVSKSLNLMEALCESCQWLTTMGQEIACGGNPFLIPSAIKQWESTSLELLLHKPFVGNDQFRDKSGAVLDPMVLRQQLADKITEYSRLSVQIATITSSKDAMRNYRTIYDQLRTFLAELRIRDDTGSTRIPPLGILLHGNPGIGKTTLINGIFSWLSMADGMEFNKNAVFRRPPGSRFWSNFNSEKLWLILDDVATFRPQSKKVDESLSDIIHVLNSSPFNPDMNQNDEKGKFVCNIRAVCATTNKLDMDVAVDFNSPDAIFRRFQYHLTVQLKPGPFNQNGKLVTGNMSKADYRALGPHSSDLYPDFWVFHKHAYVNGRLQIVGRFDSFHDLMVDMARIYKRHREHEGKIMERELAYSKETLCPRSKVPSSICNCTNCPKGKAIHAVTMFQRVFRTRAAQAAARDRGAIQIQRIARGHVARLRTIRMARAVIGAASVPSGACFSILRKTKPIPIPNVWFTWFQLIHWLCLLVIIGCLCYIVWRILLAIYRGIRRDIQHYTNQLVARHLPEVSDSLNAAVRQEVERQVVHYYPAVLLELKELVDVELVVLRNWVMVGATAIMNEWSLKAMLHGLFVHSYTAAIALGVTVYHYGNQANRALGLYNLGQSIRRHLTFRNAVIVVLISTVTLLLASYAMGQKKTSLPATVAEPQVGRPVPAPGPGGSEAPRNVWFSSSDIMNTFGNGTLCSRGSSCDAAVNSLLNNIVSLVITVNGETMSTHGYLVGGQFVLATAHSFTAIRNKYPGLPVVMHIGFPFNSSGCVVTRLEYRRMVVHAQNDLALIHIPELPSRSDKYDYFIEANHDWSTFSEATFVLPSTEATGAAILHNVTTDYSWLFSGGQTISGKITIPTVAGDCGRPLLAISKEHGVCILGLHHAALIADPLTVASAFVSRTWLMRSRDELVRKLELPQNIAVAQGSVLTASPICFGDINQADESLRDKQGRAVVLEQMSAKCALHERFKGKDENYHIDDTNIFYFGKIKNLGSRKMKSSVTSTPFRDIFEAAGFVCRKEAPKFDWKSKVLHARNVSRTSNMIDDSVLTEVVQVYTRQLLETLPAAEHSLFEVYDLHTALNGAEGVAYVDRVKVNTSAGHPFYTAKRELLYTDYDGVTLTYTLQPQFEAELYRYYDMMRSGNRPRLLFSANMKDEAISPEKNQTRGPRLFMAGNVYSILIGRMLFLSYIRVVQRNPFIFFSAPGMNAFSRIWMKLYKFITRFGLQTILAGDYKNFDQKMAPKILEAAYSVIIGVMTSKRDGFSKFTDEERLAAKVWASTCAFPECEVDGDVYQLCGSNPSGNTMTVHTNCTVNVIYIMYAWRLTGHKLEIFFLKVVIMTYGDDNMVGVCETVKVTFNYSTIYPALLEIGVEYTPADKSLPTAKMFDDLKDLQFLKRGFVMRMGRMFCPIDVATIHKLGILWVKSTLTSREHGLAVLKDIWRESAIHGGDIQRTNQALVTKVLKEYYNLDTSIGGFLSDEEFVEQYDSNSTRYEMFSTKGAGALVPIATAQHLTIQLLSGDEHTVEMRGYSEDLPGAILQSTTLVQSGILQCGTTEGAWSSPSCTNTTAANSNLITFDDENSEQVADMPLVPVKSVEHILNPVSEWLTRPVLIHENEWEEQGTVDFVIQPLQVFLGKSRIWEKLRGFSKLHANLHIKIVLNASQFHYGALLVSWFPMGKDSKPDECFSAAYTSPISGDAYGELMMESVRPHIMLFPQDNSSGELYLPYFYPKDWWDLDSTASASVDLARFGSLRVRSIAPLQVAQAVTGNKCTISIFAWLSEPNLAAPSLALAVAQSGKMMEISKATKDLTDLPVLGAAFDVTSKLARVTAAVMKLAGYSNPIDTSTVATMHLSSMPHVSSTEISVASSHLGVSKASGLSLSVCGSEADELVLADIAKKDCFIGVYPWTNGNNPGTEIFATYVTPEIFRQKLLQYKVSTEEYAAVYQSPSSYVAQMFGLWRGVMVYTVRVIASQFHSGRVRVYYDASQPVPSNPEECALYSEILDISTEKELEIRVPWNASLPYCMVSGKPLIVDAEVCWTRPDTLVFGGASYDRNLHNGALSIQVLNKLMGPVVSSVYLMVSARLEEAKFANPVQIGSQNTGYTGIPDDLAVYRPVSTYPMALAQSKFETTPASTGNVDDGEIIGEVVTSARELLHRANRYADIFQDPKVDGATVGLNTVATVSFPRIPVEPGQPCIDSAGIGADPVELTNSPSRVYFHNCKISTLYRGYNFLRISPYQYLRGAFVGERGSHIYKLMFPSGQLGLTTGVGMVSVHRRNMQTDLQDGYTDAQGVGLSVMARHQVTIEPSSAEGLSINTCSFDNSLMVSAPMYSRFKFLPTNPAKANLSFSTMGARSTMDVLDDNLTLVTKANTGSASTTQAIVLSSYHSVGVDFNFVGFVNPPVLFVAKTWPAV